MPPLDYFLGGLNKLPLLIQFDGTGFGTGQFNTIAFGRDLALGTLHAAFRRMGHTIEFFLSVDVAALRHTEHLANSGWCGCNRDFALRQTPKKPETVHRRCTTCSSSAVS